MTVTTTKKRWAKRLSPEQRIISRLRRRGYQSWWNARSRTSKPSHRDWKYYGARGIKMASYWAESFETFLADAGLPPSLRHTLDRIDNRRGYERGNTRWVLQEEQVRNTSRNIRVLYDGVSMVASQAEIIKKWKPGTISKVLRLAHYGREPEART